MTFCSKIGITHDLRKSSFHILHKSIKQKILEIIRTDVFCVTMLCLLRHVLDRVKFSLETSRFRV